MGTAQASQRELANTIRFLAIDAVNQAKSGHPDFWHKYAGLTDAVIGVDRIDESVPAAQV
jgi:transketolase